MASAQQKRLQRARRHRIVRPRDVEAHGIARENLLRLYRRGVLTRAARGVYILAEGRVTEHHTLAIAAKQVPHGVVCLLSALQFHGLTTQTPHKPNFLSCLPTSSG